MFCPNCGKEVEKHEKVCKYCSEIFSKNIDKGKIHKKTSLGVLIGIIVSVIGIALICVVIGYVFLMLIGPIVILEGFFEFMKGLAGTGG